MINVSDIISDPDFSVPLLVTRSTGAFVLGGWQTSTSTISITGVANTSSGNDLKQVPEGDRVEGTTTFYTTVPLFTTRAAAAAGVTDTITYAGDVYRLSKVWNRSPNGYYKAIGVRTAGA